MASKLSAKLSYAAVVFALSFATAISATRAAEPNTCAAGSLSGAPCSSETIFLTTGYLSLPYKLLDSEKPIATIQIGNSKIVDVIVLSDRSFTLNPLARGGTNIIFLDRANVPIKNISVVVTDAGLNMRTPNQGVAGNVPVLPGQPAAHAQAEERSCSTGLFIVAACLPQTKVPFEPDAQISDNIKPRADFFDALTDLVKAKTYRCDSISAVSSFFSGGGYKLKCNNYRYKYEIADKGGNWIVTVK
jgi:hypothetical protein